MKIGNIQSIATQGERLQNLVLEKSLFGGLWTFVTILAIGLFIAGYLSLTVFFRPLDEIQPSSRLRHTISLWIEHGFIQHGGVRVSEPFDSNPNALVYRSRPPMHMYGLYLMNLVNYWINGRPFSTLLYVFYNQAILWFSASCFGYLGFRISRRLDIPSHLSLACGITGQAIFYTFPYNLEKFFEPYPEQFSCLAVICFLLIEEFDFEQQLPYRNLWRGGCIAFLAYTDNITAIPGIAAYVLFRWLSKKLTFKALGYIFLSGCLGTAIHILQLKWITLRYPNLSLVGATYLWRSGLDGATNHVGMLTPDQLGQIVPFWQYAGVLSFLIICYQYFRKDRQLLELPFHLIFMAIGFYLVPDYFLSQYTIIHPHLRELFFIVVVGVAFCYILVPYLEKKTGNTGLLIWCLVILGFCITMYQLRLFAIKYPLSIPEPDWRIYRYF